MTTTNISTTGTAELEQILARADAAATAWAQQSAADRATVLRAIADGLDAAADQLVPVAAEETNLPPARLSGELKRTTFQLRLFAAQHLRLAAPSC